MSSTSNLRIPVLCVRVTCVPSSPMGQPLACTPIEMMQGLAAAAVQLPSDAVLLSTAYPVVDSVCIASTQENGVWTLPARDVALERSSAHPLALILPGLRLQVQCTGRSGQKAHLFFLSAALLVS